MEEAFEAVGITSAEHLRDIGANAAYGQLLRAGQRPHFIGFYVIHMGLQGRPWNDCKGKEKDELRVQFDALVADNKPSGEQGIEKILNSIGTGSKR